MDWLLKIMTGGLVPVGKRTQVLGAATAVIAIVTGVVQWAVSGDLSLMDLFKLVGDKWPAIVGGVAIYTGAQKIDNNAKALAAAQGVLPEMVVAKQDIAAAKLPTDMVKLLFFVAMIPTLGLLLSCSSDPRAQAIVDWAKSNCGVLITPASAAAVAASGTPLAGAAVEVVGKAICDSFKTKASIAALVGDECVSVDGVKVCAEHVDKSKLSTYRP